MKIKTTLAAAFVALAAPTHANAGFKTGSVLYDDCQGNNNLKMYCLGYIIGITDMLSALHTMGALEDRPCIPVGVNAGDVRDVVVKFLREHPESRHLTAASLAAIALRSAYGICD